MVPHDGVPSLLGVLLLLLLLQRRGAVEAHSRRVARQPRVRTDAEARSRRGTHAAAEAQNIAVGREGRYLSIRVEVGGVSAELWGVVGALAWSQAWELVLVRDA